MICGKILRDRRMVMVGVALIGEKMRENRLSIPRWFGHVYSRSVGAV